MHDDHSDGVEKHEFMSMYRTICALGPATTFCPCNHRALGVILAERTKTLQELCDGSQYSVKFCGDFAGRLLQVLFYSILEG